MLVLFYKLVKLHAVATRVGILPAKTYFCRDGCKNRFLPVFAGFFQNHIEFFIIVAFVVFNHIKRQYYSTVFDNIIY